MVENKSSECDILLDDDVWNKNIETKILKMARFLWFDYCNKNV